MPAQGPAPHADPPAQQGAVMSAANSSTAEIRDDVGGVRQRFQAGLFGGMQRHLERLLWTAEQIAADQRARLQELLGYAVAHSPFHARRLDGINTSTFDVADLATLPIMTKDEMMAEFDDLVTDRRLTRAVVERSLATVGAEPAVVFDEYICLATGGSSGTRASFVTDVPAMTEFASLIMRPAMSRTAAAGGSDGMTIAFVAAASPIHATGCAPRMMQGSPIAFVSVPVTLPLEEIVARLNALQPPAVYGYPSMLARLATEALAGRLRIAPVAITSTSETLLPAYRTAISEAFGAPLVDTFASTEGLIGSSEPDEPVIALACDGCIVELVDESNRPVPPGTPSARVLITNLYNRVQPLIRYQLGDSFTRQPDSTKDGHMRVTVEGRSDDVLRYAGADLHPLVLRSVLLGVADISDYQIRQTPRGVDVTVQTDHELNLDDLRARLRRAMETAGLPDPEVRLAAVSALHRHAETGKLRRVAPLAK
jgi:phenylacetate-coenzyme A ligase PaaK-like adenylate-forming protein